MPWHLKSNMFKKYSHRIVPLVMAVAVVISIGVSVLYLFLEHRSLKNHNKEQALQIVDNLSSLVLQHPVLWKYQLQKYQSIIDNIVSRSDFAEIRIISPTDRSQLYLEHVQNRDGNWKRLATLRESAPLTFNRDTLGIVEIEYSIAPLIVTAAGLLLISTLTGAGFAWLVFRMTTRATAKLEHDIEKLIGELESFNYTISHDLQAPLRSVSSFGALIMEDYRDRLDAEVLSLLERMVAASNRMKAMVDGLLELSRFDHQKMQCERVNLSGIAREIIEELRNNAPDRQVTCRIADNVEVKGDPRMLRCLLQNLIGNAWKFTAGRENAFIEFGVKRDRERDTVFVLDNGVGFDMNYAHKLFAPFQRLHSAAEFEGTGIGLATVRRIIDLHGGSIWMESQKGHGALFSFQLQS